MNGLNVWPERITTRLSRRRSDQTAKALTDISLWWDLMPAVSAPLLTAIWLNLVVVEWLADRCTSWLHKRLVSAPAAPCQTARHAF